MRKKALWRIVNKEIKEPQIDRETEIWKCKLEQARGIIGKALSPNLNRRFVHIDDPIVLWDNLEKDYKDANIASTFSIEEKLVNLDPSYFETMTDYFNEVTFLNAQLKKIGAEYAKKDFQLIAMVESKLPQLYKVFKESRKKIIQLNPNTSQQTFDQFCKSIIDEEALLIKEGYIKKNHAYVARSNFVRNDGKKNWRGYNKIQNNESSNNVLRNDGVEKQGGRKPIICKYCGGENHMEKLCLKKKDNEKQQYKPKQENFKDGKKDRYSFVSISQKKEDKTSKGVTATPEIKSNAKGGYFTLDSIKD